MYFLKRKFLKTYTSVSYQNLTFLSNEYIWYFILTKREKVYPLPSVNEYN